ncbi:FAD-dependent oxidoreductase, partial [Dietzia sp. DQ11-44]|nr:FAD-dependent oxidoreductase [Dietzia sp. DQ11-44]
MRSSAPVRADVVVVGSGPNGLAAALLCARAGRRVVVLEAEDTIGGGCRTLPMDGMPGDLGADLVVDPCSAVHPMAAAAPFF